MTVGEWQLRDPSRTTKGLTKMAMSAVVSNDPACCFIRMHMEPYPFIEIMGGRSAPGSTLQLGRDVLENGWHQLWRFVDSTMPGVYFIESAMGTGLVMTASGLGKVPSMQSRKPGADPTQLWLFCAPTDGHIGRCIMNYSGLVLDARGGHTDAGTNIVLYSRHNGDNQRWYLEMNDNNH